MNDHIKPLSDALKFAALATASKERIARTESEAREERAAEKPIAPYLVAALRR